MRKRLSLLCVLSSSGLANRVAAAGSSAWILIGRERSRVLLVYCVDPCAGVECSVGQVCQLDPQTRRALRRTERVVANCRFCCMAPDWSRAVTCSTGVLCRPVCRRGVFSRPSLSTRPSNTSCSVSLRRYRPRRTMSYDPSTSLCVGRSHLRERVSDEGHCLQATTS